MRISTLAIALLGILVVPGVKAELALAFAEPAEIEGSLESSGTWMLLRFEPGMVITVQADDGTTLQNKTIQNLGALETPSANMGAMPREWSDPPVAIGNGILRLEATDDHATLAIQMSDGSVNLAGKSKLSSAEPFEPINWVSDSFVAQSDFSDSIASEASGAALHIDEAGELSATLQSSKLEWFGVQVTCAASLEFCPDGGGLTKQRYGMAGFQASADEYHFRLLQGPLTVALEGPVRQAVIGAPALDLSINGSIHLPRATTGDCSPCPTIEDQTLYATGNLQLNDVTPSENGFTATLDGDFAAVRVDEAWIDPATFGKVSAVTAAAVIGIGVLIKLLFLPLFTRLTKGEALEHPRRKMIFEYVQHHPGANFREISRNTGIAAGTVRHHLTILERAGHLVEHQHLGTVRLFENHGKFDHNWSDVVLLREPNLQAVYDFLRTHPQSPQKDVLEGMEKVGWSRSTTQHRLSRLVEGGVVTIRLQGRLKIYNLAPRPTRPALPGPASLAPLVSSNAAS